MATANDVNDDTTDENRIGSEPVDGEGVYPFAGLTRWDEDVDVVDLPQNVWDQRSSMWFWASEYTGSDPDPSQLPERGLNTLIHELPRANHAQAAWVHPRTGEVMRTTKHNAVINPETAERITSGAGTVAEAIAEASAEHDGTDFTVDEVQQYVELNGREAAIDTLLPPEAQTGVREATTGDDALFQIAGENHTIINPQQPLDELVRELDERDMADKVFGEVRLDRGGGRGTLDLYVDGNHVESPVFDEDREPVVVGLEVQWSFFDDWAFRACGQGLDWACTNHINRLTNREVVKYAGDVDSRVDWRDWFSQILDAIDEKRDQLSRIIEQAAEETLDLGELPDDIAREFDDRNAPPWTALYAYMGLPTYLAEQAGRRLRQQANDAYEPNWWEIHSAATYAVTHHSRSDREAGGTYEDQARTANDMLFNPAGMEDRIVTNYEADREDDEQVSLAEEGGGIAEIRTAFESTREKKERFEEWAEELEEMGVDV